MASVNANFQAQISLWDLRFRAQFISKWKKIKKPSEYWPSVLLWMVPLTMLVKEIGIILAT